MLVGVKLEVAATVLSALLASVCVGGAMLELLLLNLLSVNSSDGLGNKYYFPSTKSVQISGMRSYQQLTHPILPENRLGLAGGGLSDIACDDPTSYCPL